MRFVICIFLLIGLSTACFGQLEFVGFTSSNAGMRFLIKDTNENRSSEWLRLEQSFRGFRLLAYDSQREILTVERDGGRLELPLRAPQVQSGTASEQVVDAAQKYKVGSVTIKATDGGTFPEGAVRNAMQIRSGGTFDEKALDQDVRAIYRTGQFKFIEVKHEQRGDGSFDLVVLVTPKSP